jgi:hypothetical protein
MVTNSLIAPALDEIADAFDRGHEVGFIAGLQGAEHDAFAKAYAEVRYLISSAYADMIVDGVTQESPIVHDTFDYLFKVLDGVKQTRDYKNWKPESKR